MKAPWGRFLGFLLLGVLLAGGLGINLPRHFVRADLAAGPAKALVQPSAEQGPAKALVQPSAEQGPAKALVQPSAEQGPALVSPTLSTWAAPAAAGPAPLDLPRLPLESASVRELSGSAWHVETADGAERVGTYTSLALDSTGRPHISYCQVSPISSGCTALKYAYLDGAAWISQTVDSAGEVGYQTSLALDAAGRAHIAYGSTTGVRYAHFDGATWITETVAWGAGAALALDSAGRPHIAYGCSLGICYAYLDGDAWVTRTLEVGENLGYGASLALDVEGRPHISYLGCFHGGAYLKYAYWTGTGWQIQMVSTLSGCWETSLVLDPAGRPHIAYANGGPPGEVWLEYAFYDGQEWRIELVDGGTSRHVGGYASLALDTAGRPGISYLDWDELNLKYAWYDGQSWQSEAVDSTGSVGFDTSLALDAAGRPHVSYLDESHVDLKYAYRTCTGVNGVDLAGPGLLPMGIGGLYSATLSPLDATLPLTWTWSGGAVGPTAVYTWTAAGVYTPAVGVANSCGQATDTLTVTVYCQPVEGVEPSGFLAVLVGQAATWTAALQPITASRPLTLSWDNGTAGPAAVYRWTQVGSYTVTVTATNGCGAVQVGSQRVKVLAEWPYWLYLPVQVGGRVRR